MHVVWCTQKIDLDDDVLGVYVEWMRALAARVDRLTVIALSVGRHDLPGNVRVISLGKERGASRFAYLARFYGALVRDCRGADVLVSHMSTMWAILAWPVCAARRVPIALWYAHYLVSWHLKLAVALSKVVLTSVPEACAVRSPKVRAVGQGIDVSRFAPAPVQHPGFVALSLGRISPVKKVLEMVSASALALARGTDLRLEIYGEPATGADKGYLAEVKAAASALGDRVSFRGRIPNREAPKAYAAADLFLNLTRTGSFDKTILEAMSSGLPTLVANAAYRRILPESARWLVLDDTEPETVARGIVRVAAMGEAERRSLGAALREVVVRGHALEGQMDRLVAELRAVARR